MKNDDENWALLRQRLDEVLEEAMHADGARFGKIRVVDAESGALRICAHRGLSADFLERYGVAQADDETLCAEALRRGRRVVVADLVRDGRRPDLASRGRDEGFRGLQSTPIVARDGRVVGTLSTLSSGSYSPSTSAELVLDYCARRAAGIIEEAGAGPERPPSDAGVSPAGESHG